MKPARGLRRAPVPVALIAGCSMTCGFCGHVASLDAFCQTVVAGELPRNVYQCPACRRAIQKRYGTPKVYPDGFVMPGPVELIEVTPML